MESRKQTYLEGLFVKNLKNYLREKKSIFSNKRRTRILAQRALYKIHKKRKEFQLQLQQQQQQQYLPKQQKLSFINIDNYQDTCPSSLRKQEQNVNFNDNITVTSFSKIRHIQNEFVSPNNLTIKSKTTLQKNDQLNTSFDQEDIKSNYQKNRQNQKQVSYQQAQNENIKTEQSAISNITDLYTSQIQLFDNKQNINSQNIIQIDKKSDKIQQKQNFQIKSQLATSEVNMVTDLDDLTITNINHKNDTNISTIQDQQQSFSNPYTSDRKNHSNQNQKEFKELSFNDIQQDSNNNSFQDNNNLKESEDEYDKNDNIENQNNKESKKIDLQFLISNNNMKQMQLEFQNQERQKVVKIDKKQNKSDVSKQKDPEEFAYNELKKVHMRWQQQDKELEIYKDKLKQRERRRKKQIKKMIKYNQQHNVYYYKWDKFLNKNTKFEKSVGNLKIRKYNNDKENLEDSDSSVSSFSNSDSDENNRFEVLQNDVLKLIEDYHEKPSFNIISRIFLFGVQTILRVTKQDLKYQNKLNEQQKFQAYLEIENKYMKNDQGLVYIMKANKLCYQQFRNDFNFIRQEVLLQQQELNDTPQDYFGIVRTHQKELQVRYFYQ